MVRLDGLVPLLSNNQDFPIPMLPPQISFHYQNLQATFF